MSDPTFSSLHLPPALLENLEGLGYVQPTPIQAAALPFILEGRDVLGQAKTGSGKTAAFGLGLLQRIDPTVSDTQALVICPVRELAEQVAVEIRKLARGIPNIKLASLCGGMPWRAQELTMRAGAHIVVGTPGRLSKHLRKDLLRLDGIRTLVLDEADRLLDMGFLGEVLDLVRQVPKARQTLLFSATFPDDILNFAKKIQKDAERVAVDTTHSPGTVVHREIFANKTEKPKALSRLLRQEDAESTLVFCRTRLGCQEVADFLDREGFSAAALHGDMEQRARSDALVRFANRSLSVLVATDVAARGLDIDDLPLVINYDPARNPEVHVHRLGRTGRAGRTGKAYTLVESPVSGALPWVKLNAPPGPPPPPPMISYLLGGGKKDKIRAGDIVGALVKEAGLDAIDLGKIHVADIHTVVAVRRNRRREVEKWANGGSIKGKRLKPMPY